MTEKNDGAELRFERKIQVPPVQVFRMFTSPSGIREWLCDWATANARPGGNYYLQWNTGFVASGAFTEVQPNSEVSFTWRGKDDPDFSQARVMLDGEEGGTVLKIIHSGFGQGGEWENTREAVRRGWDTVLENLTHVLEHGPDLRIVNTPMLGITFGEYSADIAEKLNVPVRHGLRLEGTLEGLGAEKAGLRKDDVIVEVDGRAIHGIEDTTVVRQGKRAGDHMLVSYYRGPEKNIVEMELGRRPLPEIPKDFDSLAAALEKNYQRDWDAVRAELESVSEEAAAHCPSPGEWCANEVLAHLIQSERATQFMIVNYAQDRSFTGDEFPDNMHAFVRATADSFGSKQRLLEDYRRGQLETVQLLRSLPADVASRRSTVWRLGFMLLSYPYHGQEHVTQMHTAVTSTV
jgi:uncharacterized protein YndB with AHSA1/START domain